MKKVKLISGLIWAFLCLILIVALFPGLTSFSASLSRAPFMRIHPRYSGGDIEKQLVKEGYTLDIRKPVFNGLINDRKNGFIQLDWRGTLPEKTGDTIDYNNDGIQDFYILIDTKTQKTEMRSFNTKAKDIMVSTATSYGWAVRINITK
jgi:hypothetical protein